MSFPEYNETNYKIAGASIAPAVSVIEDLESSLFSIKRKLRALDEANKNILRITDPALQQGTSENIVPSLYVFKNSDLVNMNLKIEQLVSTQTSLLSVVNMLIGSWQPEVESNENPEA